MLRQAIEQYQRRFIMSNRTLSSHRGPLESRRRPVGKRHMTGIMASPPDYRPTWWFELMGNKNAWQWEAPTTSNHRREKEVKMSLPGLADKFIKWLEASDLDKPFLEPPTEAIIQSSALQPATDITQDYVQVDLVPQEIAALRDGILKLEKVTYKRLRPLVVECCSSLKDRIARADISAEELIVALDPLDAACLERVPQTHTQFVIRGVSHTLVSTISSLRRNGYGEAYQESWTAVVDHISSLKAGKAKSRLLRVLRTQASFSDLENLNDESRWQAMKDYVIIQADKIKRGKTSAWLSQTSQFTRDLEDLSTEDFQMLYDAAESFVGSYIGDSEKARQLQFSWLLMMAHLPHVTPKDMIRASQAFLDTFGTLSSLESWQLSLAHLASNNMLDHETYRILSQIEYGSFEQQWTTLGIAVLNSSSAGALQYLCTWLNDIGSLPDLVRSLLSYGLEFQPADALRVMEQMIADPEIQREPLVSGIQYKTKILTTPKNRVSSKRGLEIKRLKGLLDKVAYWYMVTPHLRDRQAQRGIERCQAIYRHLNGGRDSSSILLNLALVLTRDLQRGEWGRTSRLKWLIERIARQHGEKEAAEVLKTLKGWRELLLEQQRHQSR